VEKRLEEAKNRVIEILKHKTFVTKVEKLKFGYDIYVGSAKDIFPLISTLGPVKITRKLYGEVAGRKVYRTTFLLRV
jgi:NMD protein affecting ribosome stability and mRNA decay